MRTYRSEDELKHHPKKNTKQKQEFKNHFKNMNAKDLIKDTWLEEREIEGKYDTN